MGGTPPRRRIVGLSAAGSMALACAAAASAARAAEPVFNIPEQPREAALLAFARQAGLSLGFVPDAHCEGRTRLFGRMSPDAALAKLLAGSNCLARRPDARTVVIRSRPAPAAPPQTASRAAAEPAPSAPAEVSELVVTAEKSEQLLSAATGGLTALAARELAQAGVRDVQDLSLLAAGVNVTNLGPGRDKVILRGLSDGPLTGHTQSVVGLYFGDLRLTYNAPDPDLPLIDLDRVEVLRGPQGSLYGAGSIGGVLHLVPSAPNPAARSGKVEATLASTAHGDPSSGVWGVLNQPLAADAAALRLVAWTDKAGGYIDDVARDKRDVDGTRRVGVRAALLWRVRPDLDLEAGVIDQNIDTRDAHYADPQVGPLARASATAQPHDNDFLALTLAARWAPDWGHASLSLGALDHDLGVTYDAAAAPASLFAPGATPDRYLDENHIRALVAEARAASAGAARLQWKAGLFASAARQRLDSRLLTHEHAPGYTETRRDQLVELAAFGEISYDLTPALTVTAGGRLSNSRLKTRSEVSLGAPVRTFTGKTSSGTLAPKVVAAYRPHPDLTVYAQVAEGYRAPGFNTSGPPGQAFSEPGGLQPLRRYVGDELWNYEAGGRWRAPDLGLAVRLATYWATWTDIQANLILPSGLPFTANLGAGRVRGVEAEVGWTRGPLTLKGNLVRQDPELRRSAPGLPPRPDTDLPGAADTTFAVSASYAWRLAAERRLLVSTAYAYVGRSSLAIDAVSAASMGGYGDVRLSAELAGRQLSARVFVDNLLDARGDTLAFGNPFTYATEPASTPQRPRTIGLTLSRGF